MKRPRTEDLRQRAFSTYDFLSRSTGNDCSIPLAFKIGVHIIPF
jgi:hypothetical protein